MGIVLPLMRDRAGPRPRNPGPPPRDAHGLRGTAFAPDGTLYLSAANLGPQGGMTGIALETLNPKTAAVLTSVATRDFFGALGVRPTDGVIFGGTGDQHQLFTINAGTGGETLVGDTGLNFVGDLDFRPVPEPASVALLGVGAAGLLGYRWLRRRRNRALAPA
jgi:hypothetical protein